MLIEWLNATKDAAAQGRILRVMGLFRLIVYREMDKLHTRKESRTGGRPGLTKLPAREHLERELDRALRYYAMRPRIWVSGVKFEISPPGVLVSWKPVSGSKFDRHREKSWAPLKENEIPLPGTRGGEAAAITILLELIRAGDVFKIDHCRCGKYFFKRFSHQRFCSAKCRLAEFRNSDEARQKRNAYARKLYHLHKKLDSGKTK